MIRTNQIQNIAGTHTVDVESLSMFGSKGQGWHDYSPKNTEKNPVRNFNAEYKNDTKSPIELIFSMRGTSTRGHGKVEILCNNKTITIMWTPKNDINAFISGSIIVPPGATYKIKNISDNQTPEYRWLELRGK